MLKLLETPMKEVEITAALDVSSVQTRAWLKRLMEERKIEEIEQARQVPFETAGVLTQGR